MTGGRPLTEDERGVIDVLLADDVPDVEVLRTQARCARATRGCTCGCATIDLLVEPATPTAGAGDRDPIEATVVDEAGRPVGGLLLFVQGGRLTGLEVWSFGDDPPPMPPAGRVRR